MKLRPLWIGCLLFGLFGVLGLGLKVFFPPSWAREKAGNKLNQGDLRDPLPQSNGAPTTEGSSVRLSLPRRESRPAPKREELGRKQGPGQRSILRGKLIDPTKSGQSLAGISIALYLDGRDFKLKTQADGAFVLKGIKAPDWASILFALPEEEFFFPLRGIDLAEGPPYVASLLAKIKTGKKIALPVLPWARLRIRIEGPQGQALEQARLFVRPLASPATLGRDRYRLPGRQVAQDPPLGPGVGMGQGKGFYLCEKLPPQIPLHLLALGKGLRAQTSIPALKPGQTQRLVLRLLPYSPSKKTKLRVLDLRGDPIPTAKVWLYDSKEMAFGRLFPLPNKNFAFLPPIEGGRIRVWAPGFRPGELPLKKRISIPPTLEIKLEKGGQTLRAQIRKNGKPLPKIAIHAREIPHQAWSLSWTKQSDTQGMVRFQGLAQSSGILLSCRKGVNPSHAIAQDWVPDPPILERWQWKTVANFTLRKGARIQGIILGFKEDPRELSLQASYTGTSVRGSWTRNLFNLPLHGKKTQNGFEFSHKGLPRGDYRIQYRTKVLTQFSLRPGEQKLKLRTSYR